MVIRHKLKRDLLLHVYGPQPQGGIAVRFPDLAAMDRWLDTEFQPPKYPVGSTACHGDEWYEILLDTESVPEPWQHRAALIRKVGLGFLAGGAVWLVVGLCLASRGGLHVLGRLGLSLAYLGGVLCGAAWLAGHPLSTGALEKRVCAWADGVARTATLRWRWRGWRADHLAIRWDSGWSGAVIDGDQVADGWLWAAWTDTRSTKGNEAPSRLQAMRAAEEWLWSQVREAKR